jgi:signal recognition particle subunit SEC65
MANTTTSNNTHTQKDVDLAKASVPLMPVISAVIFLILQVGGVIWYFSQLDARVSRLEFDSQRAELTLEELEESDVESKIQALEMKFATMFEKVYHGKSRSHDSVIIINAQLENIKYRLRNIEGSTDVRVKTK